MRARLVGLYAVNYEIARVGESVRQAPVGAIRLAWVRDALEDVHAGRGARAHPAIEAYSAAHTQTPFDLSLWERLLGARARDLEDAPFRHWADVDAYIDATACGLMRLAFTACGGRDAPLALAAGRAWGYAGLMRAKDFWTARGRRLWPDDVDASTGEAQLREKALAALAEAREASRAAASALFPAYGYAGLTRAYLRGPQSLLARQLRLVGAALSGRV